MLVADILKSKGARVVTVRMHETVEVAIQLLRRENIGALIIKDVCDTEGDVAIGVISERDILRALADRGPATLKLAVSALMSRPLISCESGDTVQHVRELMDQHHIRHVPVIDQHTLVGILSIRDLLGCEARTMPSDRRGWAGAHDEAGHLAL